MVFYLKVSGLNDGLWAEFDVQKFATNNFLKKIEIFYCFFLQCDDALMLQLLEPNSKDVLKVLHLAIS